MCLKKSVNYYTNSFVVLVLHVEFSGSFGYTCPSGFLVPTAYIFRQTKYQKTFSERLLRAGSISRFSSFRYVPTPKGVFAKPRDHHQQPFRAFLATMLGLLSSFRLPSVALQTTWWSMASWQVIRCWLIIFVSRSLSQSDTEAKPPRLWQKKLGLRRGHKLLICLLKELFPEDRYEKKPSAILTKRATNEMRYSRSSEGSLVRC